MLLKKYPTLAMIFASTEGLSGRALAKATLPDQSDIQNFYFMADREAWLETEIEEAEFQYPIEIKTKEDKNALVEEMFEDGHNGWSEEHADDFRKLSLKEKEDAIKGFFVARYVREREEEANSTEVFFEDPKIISTPTLIRYTDHVTPEQAMAPGFKFEGHDPEHMGLTAGGGWNERRPSDEGSLAFAFDKKDLKKPEDWKHGTHYGKYAYEFKVPYAVKVWHVSDNETQVVFDVNTVKDLKPVDLDALTKPKAVSPKPMKKGEKIPF